MSKYFELILFDPFFLFLEFTKFFKKKKKKQFGWICLVKIGSKLNQLQSATDITHYNIKKNLIIYRVYE